MSRLLLPLLSLALLSAETMPPAADQRLAREIYKEMIESKSGFGPRRWKLTVVAPPNALAGPLPSDSAIYLKTQATPPRRVRIPVTGNASG